MEKTPELLMAPGAVASVEPSALRDLTKNLLGASINIDYSLWFVTVSALWESVVILKSLLMRTWRPNAAEAIYVLTKRGII